MLEIETEHLQIVQQILQKYVPHLAVWAFGSRVKGNAKPYSDLDLAIISDAPLSMAILADLSEAFSESDLPYKVDIVDWANTSEYFKKIIEQEFVVLQKSSEKGPFV